MFIIKYTQQKNTQQKKSTHRPLQARKIMNFGYKL